MLGIFVELNWINNLNYFALNLEIIFVNEFYIYLK